MLLVLWAGRVGHGSVIFGPDRTRYISDPTWPIVQWLDSNGPTEFYQFADSRIDPTCGQLCGRGGTGHGSQGARILQPRSQPRSERLRSLYESDKNVLGVGHSDDVVGTLLSPTAVILCLSHAETCMLCFDLNIPGYAVNHGIPFSTRSPAVAEGPRDAGVPVEILSAAQM